MATLVWRGDAQPVQQIDKVVPASIQAGDKFKLTINRKDVEVTAGTYTTQTALIADVVAKLAVAVGQFDSSIEEFREVFAAAVNDGAGNAAELYVYGPTNGKPFTMTGSTTNWSGDVDVTVATLTNGDPGLNEKQFVRILGTATGGTFTLTFDGATTGAIAYNASAATVQSALEALSNIASGDVSVSGSAGGPWTVEFTGNYANSDVVLMTGDGASITKAGTSYSVVVQTIVQGDPGLNEIQKITQPGATGGTFTIEFLGQTTGNIAYNASAATVQSALEALSNVASGDVVVTGNASGPWSVEFKATYANTDVDLMIGNGASLTGIGSVEVSEITKGSAGQDEIQTFDVVSHGFNDSQRQIFFDWQGNRSEGVTIGIKGTALADRIKATFEKPVSQGGLGMGAGNVLVEVNGAESVVGYGGLQTRQPYKVTFVGGLGASDQPILSGDPIVGQGFTYWVSDVTESDGNSDGTNETQRVRLAPNVTGGTFTLSYRGQTTSGIAYNASASAVETALEALSTITDVTVTKNGQSWDVTFVDPGEEDLPLMTGSGASLTGGIITVQTTQSATPATDEEQRVTVVGNPKGGTFTLTHDGNTTSALDFDATTAEVEAALEALASITDVEVTATANGGPFTIKFRDPGGENTPQMTGDGSSLSGADISISTIQEKEDPVNERQSVTLVGSPTGGTFTLTFGGQTTGAIPYSATASVVQSFLEAISTIDVREIVVTGDAGGPWVVEWIGDESGTNQSAMSGDGSSLTSTGNQTLTVSTIQDPTGPNWFDDAENWHNPAAPSTATAPASGDTLIFRDNDTDCLYGLEANSGDTFAAVHVEASFTGRIGLVTRNDDYFEYRPTSLKAGIAALYVGAGEGSGSPLLRFNLEAVANTTEVYQTGSSDTDLPTLILKGTSTSNVLRVFRGDVGFAVEQGGDAGALATLTIGYIDSQETDASVWIGDGCTQLTTIAKSGGDLQVDCGFGTLTQEGGTTTVNKSAAASTAVYVREGDLFWSSSGTVALLVVGEGATADFGKNHRARTVTNCTIYAGATLLDPHRTVTWSNAVALIQCSIQEVTIDVGSHITLAIATGS